MVIHPLWGAYAQVSIMFYHKTLIRNTHIVGTSLVMSVLNEGVVAPWCNPLTLQPEQSGRVGSSPGRAPPLERHDKGSRTQLGLLYFCDPSAWR